ncbi:MAG TPA: carbohydrate kinase family protein [Gemmatimonadales bacterium]|nr:carbohydrate kinase family protein [Gemmatimonadales bacterium]HPF61173.1 carbohydrate kinase family protein [Gemmatimonadales bacterium]HRX19631.1 carbohydrate kinase family protein [Gemmatimonadales bacterium]
MPRLGVIGSLVWDEIHGRDPLAAPTEEWGGIAYALAALDAALPPEWQVVPLIKVGRDLAPQAAEFLRTLHRVLPGARCIEVPVANNRVVLRYETGERRCERMAGGVPGWTWAELGPMVRDLDAIHCNFISGFEMCLGTARALRDGFGGPISADLHSLLLAIGPDGVRTLQPLPEAPSWFGCFDIVQLNEDEMAQLGPDPLAVAANALGAGVSLLNVTLGARGVAYVATPGFAGLATTGPRRPIVGADRAAPIRTERIPAPHVEALDPTGCGDVFGATCMARLLAGDSVEAALGAANAAAARNATFRGATHLAGHLRGELVLA